MIVLRAGKYHVIELRRMEAACNSAENGEGQRVIVLLLTGNLLEFFGVSISK